jgi:hypothetical protein
VSQLFWHKETCSLLASVKSDHVVQYGNISGYMYGERLSDDEEDTSNQRGWWPKRTKNEPGYFGEKKPWHCDWSFGPQYLQFAFDNGKSMGTG